MISISQITHVLSTQPHGKYTTVFYTRHLNENIQLHTFVHAHIFDMVAVKWHIRAIVLECLKTSKLTFLYT